MQVHPKLQKVVPKIMWEWNMLCNLEKENRTNYKNPVLDNALLDSYLLHSRVLYAFFCTPPSNKKDPDGDLDDVSASQFFDDPTLWDTAKASLFPKMKDQNKLIHKHLAHLTYTRVGIKYPWNITEIHSEFKAAFAEFIKLLSADRKKWFA